MPPLLSMGVCSILHSDCSIRVFCHFWCILLYPLWHCSYLSLWVRCETQRQFIHQQTSWHTVRSEWLMYVLRIDKDSTLNNKAYRTKDVYIDSAETGWRNMFNKNCTMLFEQIKGFYHGITKIFSLVRSYTMLSWHF